MAETVADASVLIDQLSGVRSAALIEAAAKGELILPPLVVAELITGAGTIELRREIGELLQESELHPTPLQHWIDVGLLRFRLAHSGLNVTIPDAHVAQCALDRNAVLLSRDEIFAKIAKHVPLRVSA